MEVTVNIEEYTQALQQFRGTSEKKWVMPQGDHEARLMLITSYPSVDVLQEDDLLAGPSGLELKNALDVAGLTEKDYYLTPMVKYGIGNISKPTIAQIDECAPMLDYEIQVVNPEIILTLGAEPFKRIKKENAKITDYLGNFTDCPYGANRLLPNYSPGMIVTQDPRKRPQFREVFELARKQLNGILTYTDYRWIVVTDPEVNRELIKQYIAERKLTVGYDAEWKGKGEKEVLYTFQYSCEPDVAVILDISQDGVKENRELLETMRPLLEHPEAERMGWNIRADDKRLIQRGIIPPEETLAFDGMKAVGFIDSRWGKGLETGIRYFTNYRPYYKDLTAIVKEHKLASEDMSAVKFIDPNTFWAYCAGDAVSHRTACLAMREKIRALPPKQRDYWFNVYLPLTNYFMDVETTGIPIDIPVMEEMSKLYTDKYLELRAHLLELIKPYMAEFNPNSTPDKKKLLFDHLKLTPAYYTKSGKSPKPRAWYQKQKSGTQRQYAPSTNGKSLATIAFDLESEMIKDPTNEDLRNKHHLVKTMLDLGRVGVFANKFLCKQGTEFVKPEDIIDEEEDDELNPKKSSYFAALSKDGRIHPDFFECLNNFRSSSKPNVQNPASKVLSHIPSIFVPGYKDMSKDEQKKHAAEIPRNLRHIFCAGHPDYYWAEVDVAGADLAIAAFCSKDKRYIHDILSGGFHLKKAREYFQDPTITKDDYSKYVSAKSITFRVAYTSELLAAAMPIQAEIYAESGIYIDLGRLEYALKTWQNYPEYIAFREACMAQVDEHQYIENLKGIKYHFEDTEDFKILAGWKNESLAYPIASELALFLWDVSVSIKKRLKKDGLWMKHIYPVNSVHDASYWTVHKDLLKDNYFPEVCKYFFTKHCKITTGDNLGMEMVVADRWKGKNEVFHRETEWNFQTKNWDWKK